jgi:hypothetical protein
MRGGRKARVRASRARLHPLPQRTRSPLEPSPSVDLAASPEARLDLGEGGTCGRGPMATTARADSLRSAPVQNPKVPFENGRAAWQLAR